MCFRHKIKKISFAFFVPVLASILLSGCSGGYTGELKGEYESESFQAASDLLLSIGADPGQASMELLTGDGLTHVVTGRFWTDGMPAQYVHDTGRGLFWASRTASGYSYQDAVSYAEGEVGKFFSGTGFSCSVKSMSWCLPYDEYLYDVEKSDGKESVRDADHPTVRQKWLHRPYFKWDLQDADADRFVLEILHGAPDAVSDLSVVLRCGSFEDAYVQRELESHSLMSAFSGIRSVQVYEESDPNRYYEMRYDKDGSVVVELFSRSVTDRGESAWRSRSVSFGDDG